MKRLSERLFGQQRWIPWLFVGMFAVIIAVNGTMVSIALSSWTGLTTRNHYLEGLAYNQRLAAAQAQEALGWDLAVQAEASGASHLALTFDARDAAGDPLYADYLRVAFLRPTHEGHDFELTLQPRGAGRFEAEVEMPLPGVWDLRLLLVRGAEGYQSAERVFVAP